jgi:DUF3072 family protein
MYKEVYMTDSTDSLMRDPKDWKSGNDPITDAQQVYLDTLSAEAGEPTPREDLTKAEASEKIDELRAETGKNGNNETDTKLGDDK